MGPSEMAGKNVSPPMIKMTPITRPTNIPLSVRNVPSDSGTTFFAASAPPMREAGNHDRETAEQHVDCANDVVEGLLPVRPPKAEPLLLPWDVSP